MKTLNTEIIEGYSLRIFKYDEPSFCKCFASIEDMVDEFIKLEILAYKSAYKNYVHIPDFVRIFENITVYNTQYIIYSNKNIILEEEFNTELFNRFKKMSKESVELLGIKIADGIKDLIPGKNIYTNSGKLGKVGVVLSNDNVKYVTAKFGEVVLTIKYNGKISGNHIYKNAKFTDMNPETPYWQRNLYY